MFGFNKDFMEHPLAFLQKIAVLVDPDIQTHIVVDKEGLTQLDLQPFGPKKVVPREGNGFDPKSFDPKNKAKVKSVVLRAWREHPKTAGIGAQHPIKAYWVPYRERDALQRKLGNKAVLCFTGALSGCYIGIGPGNDPAVVHVAADVRGGTDPANLKRTADGVLKHEVARAFDSNLTDAPSVTMVGVRASNGAWAFHFQGNESTVNEGAMASLSKPLVIDNPKAKNLESL